MTRRERGQGIVEIALWVLAGVAVLGGGIMALKYANDRGERPLTPEQRAYVQSVATQQATSYIAAVATQQAESANHAPRPAAPVTRADVPQTAPVAPSAPLQAPSVPPAAPNNPRAAVPTQTPIPVPPQPPAAPPTPDVSAVLAACQSKVQSEYNALTSLGSRYRSGDPSALSEFNKRLREVTPGVINECAGVMNNGTQDASAVHSLCVMYNPDPGMAEYKPQVCHSLQPPPGETWPAY